MATPSLLNNLKDLGYVRLWYVCSYESVPCSHLFPFFLFFSTACAFFRALYPACKSLARSMSACWPCLVPPQRARLTSRHLWRGKSDIQDPSRFDTRRPLEPLDGCCVARLHPLDRRVNLCGRLRVEAIKPFFVRIGLVRSNVLDNPDVRSS